MATREIANRESKPIAISKSPDMCCVGPALVPFDISRSLAHSVKHSPNVNAKGMPVITVDSVIQGVDGNAGQGVSSGVSQGGGFVVIESGTPSVITNSLKTAHHLSECRMNCSPGGETNGTKGEIYIYQSTPIDPVQPKLPCNQPPKTSPRLEELEAWKKKLAGLDPDQADELVRFGDLHRILDDSIASLNPGKDANFFYRWHAGGARAVLGFTKDIALGVGELAYEGAKKLSPGGTIHDTIDSAILAENIRLGNVCAGSLLETGKTVLNELVKPVTEPWKKGEYGEAVTRGALELGALVFVVGDAVKTVRAARAAKAARVAELEKLAEAEKATAATKAAEVVPKPTTMKPEPGVKVPVRKGPKPDEQPRTLKEQLLLEETKAREVAGKNKPIQGGPDKPLRDAPRLVDNYGGMEKDWIKMTGRNLTLDGVPTEVHYFKNTETFQVVEFKFDRG